MERLKQAIENVKNEGSWSNKLSKAIDSLLSIYLDDLLRAAKGDNGQKDPAIKDIGKFVKDYKLIKKSVLALKKYDDNTTLYFRDILN